MKTILPIILFFIASTTYSQLKISGKVFNAQKAIKDQEVNLLLKDSLVDVMRMVHTGQDGSFVFNVAPGNYILQIGQKEDILLSRQVALFNHDVDLGKLEISFKEIQSILIEGKKKTIERKVDRTVFNVENSVVSSGGTALDVLQRTPQVSVNESNISLIGGSTVKVMIDDRMIILSGKELNDYLRSMPSDDIKSIEVMTTPPSKYEAQGNSGIINIVLKKAKADSWNLRVWQTFLQRTYPNNGGGLSFNYNKKRLILTAGVSYAFLKFKTNNYKTFFYPNELWQSNQRTAYRENIVNPRLGIDYNLTSKLSVGLAYSQSYTIDDDGGENMKTQISGNPKYDYIHTPSTFTMKKLIHDLNLHSIYKIDSLGKKLSIDLGYFYYNRKDESTLSSTYYLLNNPIEDSKVNTFGKQKINNYSAMVDMEHPTSWIKLNYGAKISFTHTDNPSAYYNLINNSPILDLSKMDHFIYKENIQAVYFSADKKLNEKWQAKAGVRMEITQTESNSVLQNQITKRDYVQFFPTVYLVYHLDHNNAFSLNYGRRINRPSFFALNPFRWYFNPNSYQVGNPFLNPSYNHNIELSYTHKSFLAKLYYMRTQDNFGTVTKVDGKDREQIRTTLNESNADIYGFTLSHAFSKIKWWESINELNIHYDENKSFLPIITNRNNVGWKGYFSTDNTFYLDVKKKYAFNIRWWYYSKGPEKMDKVTSYNNLSFALKMLFLNKKLQVTLAGEDILGTYRPMLTSYVNGIKQYYDEFFDSRYFKISLSYKIGNTRLKTINSEIKNEDMKSRTN